MGTVRNLAIANPAAGANWQFVVPAGITYRLVSFACRLVTSSDAGNRRFGYVIDEGTTDSVYFGSISNTNQTASSSVYITAYPGSEAVSWTGGMLNLGMPAGLYIPAGHRLRSYSGQDLSDSMFPADQYSNIRVRVEEFPFAVRDE
jgi:hypothetical protein